MIGRDRLKTVLRVRKVHEDRASAEAARAHQRVVAARRRLDERRDAYRARPPAPTALRPVELLALRLAGMGSLDAVEQALVAVDSAGQEHRAAEETRSFAAVRRRSAERLAERRQGEASRLAQAAAQRSLDELALLRGVGR